MSFFFSGGLPSIEDLREDAEAKAQNYMNSGSWQGQSAESSQTSNLYNALFKDLIAQQEANRNAQIEQNEIERAYQTQSAQNAMNFEHNEAMLNRNWQEYMSNTAYQRATKDMRSAGLNPILAYSNGGASSPSGSSARGATVGGGSNVALDMDTVSDFVNIFTSSAMSLTGNIIDSLASLFGKKIPTKSFSTVTTRKG